MTPRPTVLVVGVTARALGRSALAAGYEVVSVDGFGDRDLVEPLPCPREHLTIHPFDPMRAAEEASALPADAVVYTANLENHPAAVARLGRGRRLLGNPPEVLAAVRDAERVEHALAAARPADRAGVRERRRCRSARRRAGPAGQATAKRRRRRHPSLAPTRTAAGGRVAAGTRGRRAGLAPLRRERCRGDDAGPQPTADRGGGLRRRWLSLVRQPAGGSGTRRARGGSAAPRERARRGHGADARLRASRHQRDRLHRP